MPTNIKVIHGHDFIKATPQGQLDLEKSKALLIDIAAASTSLADYEIILDVRKVQTEMSVADLWLLAAELANLRKAFSRKTAVLCPTERFDQAEFFALCAQNRGFPVRAFSSFEEAIDWLNSSGQDA